MIIDTYEEEVALIGAICIEPTLTRLVMKYVSPEDFSTEGCKVTFQTAIELEEKNQVYDVLILADLLKDRIPGVRSFLASCMDVTPSVTNTEEYAKLLRSKANERELRERVLQALDEKSGSELTDTIAGICAEQVRKRPGGKMKKFSDVICRTYNGLFEKPTNRIDTGYSKLDSALKGLWGGELIVIAARPAVGKSAFALSIAENAARSGKVVQFYSLEMEDTEIGERELSRWTDTVTMDNLIDRGFESCEDGTLTELAKVVNKTAEYPIYIDDSPNVKPSKVRAQAITQNDLGLVIVDYGGLMSPDIKQDSRNLELGAISRDLKNLAKEMNIPVIMLAQLNRGVADNQKPSLRELRDSGELEQNANKCIFLWNVDKENGEVGVSVAKNRRGRCDEVIMRFDGDHMRFYETEERYEEPKRWGRTNVYDD